MERAVPIILTLFTLPTFAVVEAPADGKPKTERGSPPPTAAAPQPKGFSHAGWDRILKKYVDAAGRVDYRGLRTNDRAALRRYISLLGSADLSQLRNANEAKAFWTNAYNAICVQTLIDHDLPRTVPHTTVLGFGTNIFTEKTYKVAGKKRSLDEIEHGILRKRYRDPKLHAALVCGARSCPRLRPEAYTASRLVAQLEEECRSWVQQEKSDGKKRKNRLDRKGRVFHVSKIFDWFEEDFGGSERAVLSFLARYSSKEDREFLAENSVEIEYLPYDWTLNAQK